MASMKDHADDFAKKFRGNWIKFDSFGWHNKPANAEQWGIYYLDNRDSSLFEQMNSDVFRKEIGEITDDEDCPTYRFDSHNHWACGWVNCVVVKVSDSSGEYTPAFMKLVELDMRREEYPFLCDEDEFYEKCMEECLQSIEENGKRLLNDAGESAPNWANEVYEILSKDDNFSPKGDDGNGTYIDKDKILPILISLGYADAE